MGEEGESQRDPSGAGGLGTAASLGRSPPQGTPDLHEGLGAPLRQGISEHFTGRSSLQSLWVPIQITALPTVRPFYRAFRKPAPRRAPRALPLAPPLRVGPAPSHLHAAPGWGRSAAARRTAPRALYGTFSATGPPGPPFCPSPLTPFPSSRRSTLWCGAGRSRAARRPEGAGQRRLNGAGPAGGWRPGE